MRSWRSVAYIGATLVLFGCASDPCTAHFGPLENEAPVGLMLEPRDDGIEVECRGLQPLRCRIGYDDIPPVNEMELAAVERIVVSCVGSCNADAGQMRVDAVTHDRTQLIANGAYGAWDDDCLRP